MDVSKVLLLVLAIEKINLFFVGLAVNPKNHSKKYTKHSNLAFPLQESLEFENKSVELLPERLLPAARPKKC